jgi:hypothetical protein
MALYDTRTFRIDNEWWVAQVHGSVGAGFGGAVQATRETVFFTCVTDQDRESKSGDIPAGTLNRMNHESLVNVLRQARPFGHRMPISPANAPPDIEEVGRTEVIQDDERLRWTYRTTTIPVFNRGEVGSSSAIEVICLDDSALKGVIGLDVPGAGDTARGRIGELVRAVKNAFRRVGPL